MRRTISIFLILVVIFGCGTMNKLKIQNINIPDGVSVSPRLIALCDLLNEGIRETGNIELFVPNEQTIRTYALKNINGRYWVSGFLTVTPDFSADNAITAKGGMLTAITFDTFTYSVPLQDLNELLHMDGIIKADCAKPVSLLSP